MSLATVTVTVLPLLLAHASVAALTALVSASPEEAMSILRSTGPLADAGALDAPSSSKPPPPPQAEASRAPLSTRERLAMRRLRVMEWTPLSVMHGGWARAPVSASGIGVTCCPP